MFPNEKARLMRMMDCHGIPAINEAGAKMNFTQRIEWLIEYANQQLRAADVVSPAEEKEYLAEMNKVAMCNIYTNEHFWVIGSNTSRISAPYVGQPCQCGAVLWQAAEQSFAPDVTDSVCYNGNHQSENGICVVDGGLKP